MKAVNFIILFVLVMCSGGTNAQSQQGVVKTKGRMVNGKHVAGKGLAGTTVAIQGRSAVLTQGNGGFSFPVTNKTFMVQSVQKQGYQLVDADAAPKAYTQSGNPLCLVMETPEQQAEDKLTAERKIRRTLQRQLQQREDELEYLKEQNKLTQEEYRKRLEQLYNDQQNNERLIADMAKEYSQIDYDQLDELNRQISDAILNGELTRADSLLRSKGDIKSRIATVRKAQATEAKEEAELAQRQEALVASKVGTRKKLDDLAQDCKNYFDRYKMSNQHDSAAYYIELRAELDTTNAEWQFNAAYYLQKQNQFPKAEQYYQKTIAIYRRLAQSNPQAYEPDVAMALNNFANLYKNTQRFSESEEMYKEALIIRRRLAQANPQAYEPALVRTLHNLAGLYKNTKRFKESEEMYKEALAIRRRQAQSNPQVYESDLAMILGNCSFMAIFMKHYAEAEQLAREGLEADSTKHFIYTNLAHAMLFQGKYTEAEKIYHQYKEELKDGFLDDFKQFAEAGVVPPECEADVEKIKQLLNE